MPAAAAPARRGWQDSVRGYGDVCAVALELWSQKPNVAGNGGSVRCWATEVERCHAGRG